MSFTGFLTGFYIHGSEHQVLSDVSTLLQEHWPAGVHQKSWDLSPNQDDAGAEPASGHSHHPLNTNDLRTRRYQCLTNSTALHANTAAGFWLCGHISAVIPTFTSLTVRVQTQSWSEFSVSLKVLLFKIYLLPVPCDGLSFTGDGSCPGHSYKTKEKSHKITKIRRTHPVTMMNNHG